MDKGAVLVVDLEEVGAVKMSVLSSSSGMKSRLTLSYVNARASQLSLTLLVKKPRRLRMGRIFSDCMACGFRVILRL